MALRTATFSLDRKTHAYNGDCTRSQSPYDISVDTILLLSESLRTLRRTAPGRREETSMTSIRNRLIPDRIDLEHRRLEKWSEPMSVMGVRSHRINMGLVSPVTMMQMSLVRISDILPIVLWIRSRCVSESCESDSRRPPIREKAKMCNDFSRSRFFYTFK